MSALLGAALQRLYERRTDPLHSDRLLWSRLQAARSVGKEIGLHEYSGRNRKLSDARLEVRQHGSVADGASSDLKFRR